MSGFFHLMSVRSVPIDIDSFSFFLFISVLYYSEGIYPDYLFFPVIKDTWVVSIFSPYELLAHFFL